MPVQTRKRVTNEREPESHNPPLGGFFIVYFFVVRFGIIDISKLPRSKKKMAYAHFSTDFCFADMRLDFILDSLRFEDTFFYGYAI